MDQTGAPPPVLLDALWRVVAREGWHGLTFARVAAESGEPLAELRAAYRTPVDLLRAHAMAVDRAVLEGTVPGGGFGSARDRVFDLLMRRFDALAPHRDGILRLQRDLMRDPLSALMLSPILMASMAWTLEGAGVPTGGLAGALRVQGVTGVWLAASRTWATDESADLGTTMAALDRALDQAEKVARTLRLDAGDADAIVAPAEAMTAGPAETVPGADAVPPDLVEPADAVVAAGAGGDGSDGGGGTEPGGSGSIGLADAEAMGLDLPGHSTVSPAMPDRPVPPVPGKPVPPVPGDALGPEMPGEGGVTSPR